MKKLILLFSLSLFLFSCGDNNGSSSNVKSENNIKNNDLPKKEVKKLKEVVIERYTEGDKKIVGFYDGEGSNEVIVKRVHYYSQNDGGDTIKEENYKNGKLEGKYFEWYKDGKKEKESNYKNGKLHGKYFEWDEDGKKEKEFNYKNGKLKEVVKEYENGDKRLVEFYDGEESNEVIVKKIYYLPQNDGGGKWKEENYKNGKLEGKYFTWFIDGELGLECNYKNGILHGVYKKYEKNGKVETYKVFKNGKCVKYKYYVNGKVKFDKSLIDGIWVE